MEQTVLWQKLAKKWHEAANEVAVPALKRWYLERAATYQRMAAQDGRIRPPVGLTHIRVEGDTLP